MKQDDKSRPDVDPSPPPEPRLGLQFSVLSLLALTTVSAGVLALVRSLNLPVIVKLIFAGYAILMAAYVLLRGVALCRKSLRLRRQVTDRRRELETWLKDNRK
jgi:hypothetical protein